MDLNATLLSVIACPTDKCRLTAVDDDLGLRCPQCEHVYPVIDGIPVLLPASAQATAPPA
ncbi:Trm112 family protein [soil metagenome]